MHSIAHANRRSIPLGVCIGAILILTAITVSTTPPSGPSFKTPPQRPRAQTRKLKKDSKALPQLKRSNFSFRGLESTCVARNLS
ncbi:hypothetical protein BC830DRAFT_1141798 [Chytriomyces sp. MP71]|nr:hypothetical protein BC830DRAFT_1141798 [Chytriomyces sp. MP71]